MTRRSQRRGILLLIVLSLLVLFVLIGVTFLVVANQYTRSAKASAKHDLKGDDPAKELDGALYLLLRGTTDTSNLTFRHNLFGDLYGRDGFAGTVLGRQDEAGGEFIRLAIRLDRPLDPNYPIPPVNRYYSGVPNRDYFAGSVLTLIDGSGRGQSARIVRYSPATTVNNTVQPAYVVVTPFESQKVFKTQFEATGFAPREADRFVINGKPFNGTGDGFNVESGELDQEEIVSERPVALLPNYRQSEADQMAIIMGQPRRMITMGDGDESWDAVDYQNFILARIPTTIPPGGTPLITDPLIPSFHRPFLINYWMQDPDTEKPWDGNNPNPFADPISSNRRRMVIARPMPQDHPYFTGSNPALTSHRAFLSDLNRDGAPDDLDNDGFADVPITLGPWDVDNDNDGVNDSIWVDLGMPAKTAPDGRLYKPLFAVLCVDLDGRLNVNAHGVASSFKGPLNPDRTAAGASGSAVPIEVTRGQGYGPADIRLEPALNVSMIDALLLARWNSPAEVALSVPPSPGFPGEDPSQGFDTLSFLKQWDMPRNFQTQFQVTAPQLPGSAYATPSDLRGIGAVYLDLAGQPRYAGMMLNNETIDDPYESDLVSPNASDSLFTVNDQEQLLRFADMDTTAFAGRLRQLMLPALVTNPHQLRRFTTSSFDIPAPNVLAPLGLRVDGIADEVGQPLLGLHISLSDLVRARLIANGFARGQPQEDRLRLADEQVRLMLAPELRQGQRLDINRWLSNSRDDTTSGVNTSGVVDEPGENGTAPEVLWAGSPYESPVRFAANDPHFKADLPHYSRQLLARHLYCLMMLLIDSRNGEGAMVLGTDFVFDGPQLPNLPDKKKATARRIAQWAINVVDFRDPDVIMTPFEFDLEPFDENGWNVDDDYRDATADDVEDRAIVWGCEHPELVITETVAWHDRRVRDTNKEIPTDGDDAQTRKLPAGEDPEMFMPDQDLDQYRIPQGTLLLELYCGRNRLQNNSIAPNELYFQNKSTGQLGLDLGRVVQDSPVWRIAIGQPDMSDPKSKAVMLPAQRELDPNILNPNQFDPNDETMLLGTGSGGTLTPDAGFIYDRYVIFTNGVPGNVAGDPTRYYFNRGAAPLLEPGQYAVVGPYRPLNPNDHRNKVSTITMGSKQGTPPGDPSEPSDQQILLSSNGIVYRQLANGAPLGVPNTKPAVGIMVSANITDPEWNDIVLKFQIGTGLNVSEPLPMNYYDEPTWSPDAAREFNSYYGDIATSNILPDVPFDEEDNPILGPARLRTGTNPTFRVAVLQRLADPTKGWNPTTNPYISIDAQPIDLTVFNGEDQSDRDPASWDRNATYANGEAYDLVDDEQDKIARHFDTRERGGVRNIDFTAAPNPILWNPLPELPPETDGVDSPPEFGGADAFWKYPLNHSLGYLNRSYENPATLMPRLNAPPEYVGDPADPFSWLVWNNRPYVSHLELMQVPSGAPWRLLYEFRGGVAGNSYEDSFTDGFPHLMNFFHSDDSKGTHANLCRIFDYVEVPSRFVGTEKWFGATYFANLSAGFASSDLWEFQMPNNKVSLFRDPGRINVNTIPDAIVWRGVDPRQNTTWNDLSRSLRGKPDGERRPAFYTNPVRSAASAGLMPTDDLNQIPVNATLLRSHPSVTTEPLFGFNPAQASGAYENPLDNSYFRYHKLQRLGNLLTTHSNVYAIWITVGYFEVHPWNANAPLDLNVVPMPDPVHPDGFQLGRELGSDTGEIKRHRAFYIIDRSIPVAFEPGENHNVDKSILLRRMIE